MLDKKITNTDLFIASLIELTFPKKFTDRINEKFKVNIKNPATHENLEFIVNDGELSFNTCLTIFIYFYLVEKLTDSKIGKQLKYIQILLKIPDAFLVYLNNEYSQREKNIIEKYNQTEEILFSPHKTQINFINKVVLKANELGFSQDKKRIEGLSPEIIEHPLDRITLNKLKKLPGFDKLVKIFVHLKKREIELNCLASNLEVNENSMPHIYKILEEACEILDLKEKPSLFIEPGFINGYTIGVDHNIIVLSSGAISCLSRNELLYIIGHEIGHIKCNHVLYGTILKLLAGGSIALSSVTLGIGGLLTAPLLSALYYWSRCSELSADRAGLLCCQNKIDVVRTIIKISGYPLKHYNSIDVQSYIDQANKLRMIIKKEALDNILYKLNVIFSSHPKNVIRVSELLTWIEAGEYDDIYTYTKEDFEKLTEMLHNPLILSLQNTVVTMLADWIQIKENISLKEAMRSSKHLILLNKFDKDTFCNSVLRIELNIIKSSPSTVTFNLLILYNKNNKVLKTKIENKNIINWDELSSEARKEFITNNSASLKYIIYDKEVYKS